VGVREQGAEEDIWVYVGQGKSGIEERA